MKAAVLSEQLSVENDVPELLCMPQVLIDLIEACLGDSGVQSLADIVLQDAALTTRILSTASKTSSQSFNSQEPVSSAIQSLGVPMITGIALQAAKQVMTSGLSGRALEFQYGLWMSSRISGIAARCLAPSVNYPHIEEAQLSGLFLNLGIQIFFSRDRDGYAVLDVSPWSSPVQCQFEQTRYGLDHLQLADALIGQWQLDSFLADSILFLHADILQVEQSSPLLKVARLANSFSQSVGVLSEETYQLADHLFGLNQSEVEYLFDWTQGLYPASVELLGHGEKLGCDFSSSIGRLTDLTFMLADQEAARARLAGAEDRHDLVRIARSLYLENSTAVDAAFFLLDRENNQLAGIPVEGQPRMTGEMRISFDADICLATKALSKGELYHSFLESHSLTVTDQLLMRLCKCPAIFCIPFRQNDQALGVAVLGIRDRSALDGLQSLQIRMFAQVIGAALHELIGDDKELLVEGSHLLLDRVSHEINTPLTIIGNYAEVLRHIHENDDNSELAEAIKKEALRIDEIVKYYLQQQDIPDFPGQKTDLNQLIRETLDSIRDEEFATRRVDVQLALADNLEKLSTNPVLVRQILINLIRNAAEALTENGTIRITTRTNIFADSGRYVEVVVHDNGPGIAEHIQRQLFSPVVSTKGAGHSGLGLSIVKTMVADLGGKISCHSSPEEGTGFYLLLPLDDQPLKNAQEIPC